MFLLSLTATCQVWTVSLKAGLYTYNRPAADANSLRSFFAPAVGAAEAQRSALLDNSKYERGLAFLQEKEVVMRLGLGLFGIETSVKDIVELARLAEDA